jgi:SSS family solute:Na+ symporter
LIPFGFLLAWRVRRLEVYTLPDILGRAYGDRVAIPGAVVIVVAWCGVVAAQIVAGALLLESVSALSFQTSVALIAAAFTLYTYWGGQISVIRTDAWQVALLVGGLLITLGLVVQALDTEGLTRASIPPDLLAFPVSDGFGWYELLVFYPVIVGMPYLVGPDIYSRVLCARDERATRNAALTAAAAVIPLALLLAVLGLAIRIHLPGLAPDSALPTAVVELAPVGLRGLIVVGILGAVMSSADTTLMSASTILALNVVSPLVARHRRWGGPPAAEGQLRVTRGFVLALGVVAWAIAASQGGIIPSLLLAYTVFVGGVALPTLASFWRHRLRIGPATAMWAVLLGGGVAMLAEMREGAALRLIVGQNGIDWLSRVLGSEHGSLLPVLLSLLVLMFGGLVTGEGSGSDEGD